MDASPVVAQVQVQVQVQRLVLDQMKQQGATVPQLLPAAPPSSIDANLGQILDVSV